MAINKTLTWVLAGGAVVALGGAAIWWLRRRRRSKLAAVKLEERPPTPEPDRKSSKEQIETISSTFLRENPTTIDSPHRRHARCARPCSRMPQRRYASNSSTTNLGRPPSSSARSRKPSGTWRWYPTQFLCQIGVEGTGRPSPTPRVLWMCCVPAPRRSLRPRRIKEPPTFPAGCGPSHRCLRGFPHLRRKFLQWAHHSGVLASRPRRKFRRETPRWNSNRSPL